jgi:hypothetical protein
MGDNIKHPFVSLLIICFFSSCQVNQTKQEEKKLSYFEDFVELEKLESIEVSNNKGKHQLTKEQQKALIIELKKMTVAPNIAIKLGAKFITLITKDGKTYYIDGGTHSDYVEVGGVIIPKNHELTKQLNGGLFFNTNGLNIDNY